MVNTDDQSPTGTPRKRFALVIAAYNVRRYLDDFTRSLERQKVDPSTFEVIFVDDGSTDDTRAWLDAWAERTPLHATVLSQPNAGQGAARNTGMRAATAEWITFPDPDDWVGDTYLKRVAKQLDETPSVSMIATNRVMFHEAENEIAYNHPLAKFFYRDHVVRLERRPDYFHGGSNSAFMPLDLLREHGLEFDTRIRANFEDGLFNASLSAALRGPVDRLPQVRRVLLPQARGQLVDAAVHELERAPLHHHRGARLPRCAAPER
ncbi:glycosyltransferase family 2 protein [Demequina litorisediminis]|uniref:Glycosyltransferase 2-like domain-containing protein n=1 Tax=Demequina litorisediminis TaxID=1849022 RepID=A0ABQ6IF55_9MICO|nr:glycosyltransferase family A protein [Demequina litorisediminis]GMA36364.1 hypothetical protein GCM10025876_25680 [Demequina litorisediminis]